MRRRARSVADLHEDWLAQVETEGPFLALPVVKDIWPDGVDRLGDALSGRDPVRLSLAGGGCFPDVTRARVLWCGVRGGESLAPLARSVRRSAP